MISALWSIVSDAKSVLSYRFCIPNNLRLQNVEAGQAAPLDRSSHLLSGSMEIRKENENFVEATGATLIEPVLKKVQNDLKV